MGRFDFYFDENLSLPYFGKDVTNIIVGDFNGDGKDDFIRQEKGAWDNDNSGTAEIFLSNGDGTFSSQALTNHTQMKGDFTNLIIGDFNGDGKDDFIRQEKGAWDDNDVNTAQVYISNGNGSFSSYNLDNYLKGDNVKIMVGDFNGDGKDDFIFQGIASIGFSSFPINRIKLSNGDGTFSEINLQGIGITEHVPLIDTIIGDFNGDGKDDFIRREYDLIFTNNANLYLSNGDGSFVKQDLNYNNPNYNHFHIDLTNIIVGDFNGDGKDDFIRQEKGTWDDDNSTTAQFYLSNADGTFAVQLIGDLKGDTTNIIVSDFNGDNYDDFLLQRKSGGKNTIYFSHGDGTFVDAPINQSAANTFNSSSDFSEIVPLDFDGNGRADILVNDYKDTTVASTNTLLVGEGKLKVDSLSRSNQLNPELEAQIAQNFALTTYSRYPAGNNVVDGVGGTIRESGQREGTAYGMFSAGVSLSYSTSKYLATISSSNVQTQALSPKYFKAYKFLNKASYLAYAGELVSYILAASGKGDVASYFGNANNPALDLFDLANRDKSLTNNSDWLDTLADLGLHTAQILLNTFLTVTLLDPVVRYFKGAIQDSINANNPNLNALFYDSGNFIGRSWHGKTNGGVEENRFASIHGTSTDDILSAPLYVNGGGGNDAIIGRLDRSDDLYWAYINRVASLIFHKNGTGIDNAYIQPTNNPEIHLGNGLEYNQIEDFDRFIVSWDNPGGVTPPELGVGFTQTDPGWQNFYSRYREELYRYFFVQPSKQVIDHLLHHSNDLAFNYADINGFGTELRGGADNDTIFSKFDTYIYGDEGDDYIKTAMTAKNVYGGSGDDVIVIEPILATNALKNVNGGTGNDQLILNGILNQGAAKTRIPGYPGLNFDLYIRISDSAVTYDFELYVPNTGELVEVPIIIPISGFESIQVLGDFRDNYITAGSSANTMYSVLHGLGGKDRLFGSDTGSMLDGGAGDDYLIGGDGEDVLIGGTGKDTLSGRDGADIYVIDSFQNDSQFADIISFDGTEGDFISINVEAFGHITDAELYSRFQYQGNLSLIEPLPSGGTTLFEGGILTFDGIEIARLPYPTDFVFERDVVFSNYWLDNPDFSVNKLNLNGSVANGYIQGATVILDKNFNSQWDEGENYAFTDEFGQYNLEYDLANYDTNGNGVLDPEEAQIVAIGGIDTTTGLPLLTPFIASGSSGAIVSPLTTIKTNLEQSGLSPEAAQQLLAETLGLNEDLDEFNPYEAEIEQHQEGVNTVLAHILLHSIIVNGTAFLEAAGYTGNSSEILTQVITDELLSGAEVELEEAQTIERIFTLALESVAIDSVSTDTVSNIAQLIGVLNDFMEDILEQEDDDDDDEEPTFTNTVTNLNPIKHLLLGELQELTTQLTKGEINLEEALNSLDADLNEIGFKLILEKEVEDGEIKVAYEVADQNSPVPDTHFAVGTNQDDSFVGTQDNDVYRGLAGNDLAMGNAGADLLDGGDGENVILGGTDDDFIIGGFDADKLFGNGDDDVIEGGDGNDIMRGDDGDDQLNGAGGDDNIHGGNGDDTIYGGDGNDLIFGSSGDDLLAGGTGSDLLLGGDGADIFVIQSDSKVDIFRDFVNGVDRLGLANQLSLEDLNIVAEGNSTLIQDLNSNTLAFLSGVDSSMINSNDFTTI